MRFSLNFVTLTLKFDNDGFLKGLRALIVDFEFGRHM